ncbi:MAG: ribose-phosphate pyrophosphokinase [bacterium]
MDLKIIAGNSNPSLAQGIAKYLRLDLVNCDVKDFSDGEIFVQIHENVRGADVFVIQSTCPPVNDNLMELLVIIDALKRSSANRVTAVVPYYGYARQDRKVQPRVPISAKLVADLITTAGADRLLTMDLHAGQIQGFFDIPVDNLFSTPVMIDYIRRLNSQDLVIVSPDAGGVERARAYAKRLKTTLSIIDKRRDAPNQSEVMNIIGDVDGRDVFIVDDIVDTAGTLSKAAHALKKAGAKKVYACCTHGVLSGSAIERIEQSDIEQLIVTDTIPLSDRGKACKKIVVNTVADVVGETIHRINIDESVSSLFM